MVKAAKIPANLVPIVVTPFDVDGGALPERVAVFTDPKKALKEVRANRVDIALVNLETVCAAHADLQPVAGETDEEKFKRWTTAMDRAWSCRSRLNRSYMAHSIGMHQDGSSVVEIIRLNSSTVFVSPTVSRRSSDGWALNDAVADGNVPLYCTPSGYAVIFNGNTYHSFPARSVGNDDRRVIGPHLPADGKETWGRLRARHHSKLA